MPLKLPHRARLVGVCRAILRIRPFGAHSKIRTRDGRQPRRALYNAPATAPAFTVREHQLGSVSSGLGREREVVGASLLESEVEQLRGHTSPMIIVAHANTRYVEAPRLRRDSAATGQPGRRPRAR